MAMRSELRAELYELLAESLAGMPDWMLRPVFDWPLFLVVADMAGDSPAAAAAVESLSRVPVEGRVERERRYANLFNGQHQPQFWLYESMQREGTLLGNATNRLARLYRLAGLEVVGAELPDHASVELGFLAFLVRRQISDPDAAVKWHQLERRFLKRHAGCWLPQVGQALVVSGDSVYGPIGQLLKDWLAELIHPVQPTRKPALQMQPVMREEDKCTLCGFCVQICPTAALRIGENDHETRLSFLQPACTSCRKCIDICGPGALASGAIVAENGLQVLLRSPRTRCQACGEPTFSLAELNFVHGQLGEVAWLTYCQNCRQRSILESK